MRTRFLFPRAAHAAIVLAAGATVASAATTITTPFRGVKHIERSEPAGAVVPRQVVMHIIEIDLTDPLMDFITTPGNGAEPGEFTAQKTSQFATQHGTQIAINADFFSSAGTGPNGEIYRDVTNLAASNGELISPWPDASSTRGALNISSSNVATLVRPATGGTGTFLTNPSLTPYNAVGGNQRMLSAGAVITTDTAIHPRTVIGYKGTTLYLFTVDGRQPGWSDGMTLVEIANFLKDEYGVTHALNLDGGGSTTLVFADPTVRVVNRPSDGTERYNGNNFGVFAANWPRWNKTTGGNWSAAANWSTFVPNGIGHVVTLGNLITSAQTVTMDTATTLGTLTFDGSRNYTIAGPQRLTLDVAFANAALGVNNTAAHTISAQLRLNDAVDVTVTNAGASLTFSGALDNAAGKAINKAGAGVLEISGTQTHGAGAAINLNAGSIILSSNAGSAAVGNLNLNVNAGAADIRSAQHLASLALNGTATATLGAGGDKTIKTRSLAIASGAKLNATDNDVVIDHTGGSAAIGTWNGSAYTGASGLIARGRAGGTWTGDGLTSSSAATAAGLTALAVAEASQVLGLAGTQTALWSGQTVDASSVLVKYTYDGDANLDGRIDIDDYGQIDFNTGSSGSVFGYFNGDFNLDGKINIDDYGIIDFNVTAQTGTFLASTAAAPGASGPSAAVAVPEPAALSMILLASSALLRRGRRAATVAGGEASGSRF
ncbi:MAG: phosphodiester glycosidase family protein [Tepidisphaeraceae bacterium]